MERFITLQYDLNVSLLVAFSHYVIKLTPLKCNYTVMQAQYRKYKSTERNRQQQSLVPSPKDNS